MMATLGTDFTQSSSSGRIAGALFLSVFGLYGAGAALADTPLGTTLIVGNSLAVMAIGALVFNAFRAVHPNAAKGYLAARAFEATVLAVGGVLIRTGSLEKGDPFALNVAMTVLGLGSVPLLLSLRLPRWLKVWGVTGYSLLALGSCIELAGPRVAVISSIPGGLFEVVLGGLLLAKGFGGGSHR